MGNCKYMKYLHYDLNTDTERRNKAAPTIERATQIHITGTFVPDDGMLVHDAGPTLTS
jgi:hypothetical protein